MTAETFSGTIQNLISSLKRVAVRMESMIGVIMIATYEQTKKGLSFLSKKTST